MRDLMKVSAARLRIEATKAGWQRDPVPFFDGDRGPLVRWRRSDGVLLVTGDPDVLAPGLKHRVRALLVGWFAQECPCCSAKAGWLDEEGLAAADLSRVAVTTMHGVVPEVGVGWAAGVAFAIEHELECPVSPAAIEWAATAGNN